MSGLTAFAGYNSLDHFWCHLVWLKLAKDWFLWQWRSWNDLAHLAGHICYYLNIVFCTWMQLTPALGMGMLLGSSPAVCLIVHQLLQQDAARPQNLNLILWLLACLHMTMACYVACMYFHFIWLMLDFKVHLVLLLQRLGNLLIKLFMTMEWGHNVIDWGDVHLSCCWIQGVTVGLCLHKDCLMATPANALVHRRWLMKCGSVGSSLVLVCSLGHRPSVANVFQDLIMMVLPINSYWLVMDIEVPHPEYSALDSFRCPWFFSVLFNTWSRGRMANSN